MSESTTSAARQLLHQLTDPLPKYLSQAADLRHEIHQHPDLSGEELPTAERILEYLPEFCMIELPQAGFGLRIGPGFGPTVAIRAELDALPVVEETGVDWASTSNVMHACGHDVHMAALWALIQCAKDVPDLPIPMLALFQSSEEVQPSGAETIVKGNLLAEHNIAAIIGAHVQPRLAAGVVSTGLGVVNAATDGFEIKVLGEPGHGAYPHVAVDPVPVLAAIIQGLQEIVTRDINPMHPSLITVGEVHAGTAGNVIPESGYLRGIIRAFDEHDRARILSNIARVAENTTLARGAQARVTIHKGDPVLSNADPLVKLADPLLAELGIPLADPPFRSLGSDDFAHYSQIAPTLMTFVGTGIGAVSYTKGEIALHHPQFLPSDHAIELVAKALAAGYVAGAGLAGAL
ncbi:MAG: amidohydrolase [Propionibacteriaceae bacterium]|jgi:amidohydrolase|nr:amidohydrolase [Propionibacteriaceae bacterium]